ncbi:MAG: hypothetical protein R3E83_07840 [Burkholderiaceae bacterium]
MLRRSKDLRKFDKDVYSRVNAGRVRAIAFALIGDERQLQQECQWLEDACFFNREITVPELPAHRGWILLRHGEPTAGLRMIFTGVRAIRDQDGGLFLPYWLATLAQACLEAKRPARALGVVKLALHGAEAIDQRGFVSELWRIRALALAGLGAEPVAVDGALSHAADLARECGAEGLLRRIILDRRAAPAPHAVRRPRTPSERARA